MSFFYKKNSRSDSKLQSSVSSIQSNVENEDSIEPEMFIEVSCFPF